MSPFKQMFAQFGVGAAQVDTRVLTTALVPGETVRGAIEIRGGDVAQQVDAVTLQLVTKYQRESDNGTYWHDFVLAEQRVSEQVTVQPQTQTNLPFAIPLPPETPLTIGRQEVFLRTKLAIPNAIDPRDTDSLLVRPHPTMQRVLDALETLGFRLHATECTYNPYTQRASPLVQEFEFKPDPRQHRDIEELEMVWTLREDALEIWLELDKRSRGWSGMIEAAADLNERYLRLSLPHSQTDPAAIRQQLEHAIRQMLSAPASRRW